MGIYLSQPVVEKSFDSYTHEQFKATSAEMQGWRKSMEDASLIIPSKNLDFPTLFAVFDGHGGL